jgi:uncharacterized protein YbjQ (UPF0145 family)
MLVSVKEIAEKYNLDLFFVSQAVSQLDKSKQGEVNGKLAVSEEAIPEFFEILKKDPAFKAQYEQMEKNNAYSIARSTVLLSTTPTLTTHNIIEYKGVISSEIGIGTGMLASFSIALADLGGGESDTIANKFALAKSSAFDKIRYDAYQMGCNAIVSVSTNIMVTSREMVVYSVVGTAVKIAPIQ